MGHNHNLYHSYIFQLNLVVREFPCLKLNNLLGFIFVFLCHLIIVLSNYIGMFDVILTCIVVNMWK